MRNVHKAQPAGERAFKETAHMDEADGKVVDLREVATPMDQDPDALPAWVDGNQLIAMKAKTPPVLIGGADEKNPEDGAVLREKRKLVVGGSSKMGKTWSLCDLALAIAAGGYWLGRFKCEQGAVLYVNLELDGSTAGRRMEWIASERGLLDEDGKLSDDVSANLLAWNLRGKCYDLTIMLSAARQRLKASEKTLKMIILDPVYKTYGGRDENAAGDMASLMLELEQFADECGAAIAFAAHFSKGNQAGKEAMDRISGSGVMARDPDAIVTFTPHEEESCFVLEASLREFAPLQGTVYEWVCPVLNPRDELDPAKLRQAGKAAVSKAPERAAAIKAELQKVGGSMNKKSAIKAAIAATTNKIASDSAVKSWDECLRKNKSALNDVGVEEVFMGAGKATVLRVKNDPF